MEKTTVNLIHEWLVDQFEAAKIKNKVAHKNNDTLKKERHRGEMLAYRKAFIKVQDLRRQIETK